MTADAGAEVDADAASPSRWHALLDRLGARANGELHKRLYDQLRRDYAESGLAYHTLTHIAFCLAELDRVPESFQGFARERLARVESALWYHDIIYNPRATDNEARSAERAAHDLRACGVSEEAIKDARRLILTTDHKTAPRDNADALVICIDLAILGQPGPVFGAYERAIREEYAYVPEAVFRTERAAVLQDFLDRPRIYLLPWFHAKYEARARRNLERSLSRLEAGAAEG